MRITTTMSGKKPTSQNRLERKNIAKRKRKRTRERNDIKKRRKTERNGREKIGTKRKAKIEMIETEIINKSRALREVIGTESEIEMTTGGESETDTRRDIGGIGRGVERAIDHATRTEIKTVATERKTEKTRTDTKGDVRRVPIKEGHTLALSVASTQDFRLYIYSLF